VWGWRGWLRGPPCCRARIQGAHVGGDVGGQVTELVLEPGLEGGDAIVVEEPTVGEDLGDASDADPITVQHVDQLRVPQLLVIGMPGEQHDQRTVALGDQCGVPALCLAEHLGDLTHPDQGGVGRLSVGSPVEGSPGSGEMQLQLPAIGGSGDTSGAGAGRGRLPRGASVCAGARTAYLRGAGEGELVVGDTGEVGFGDHRRIRGLQRGLQPAQPAVVVLHRHIAATASTARAGVPAPEVVASTAVPAIEHSPGQTRRAA
jgi:hypothetical protein